MLRQHENATPNATGYLIFDDTIQPKPHNGCQKRWQVEVYHKSLKQNANLGKSPAHSQRARFNHMFLATYAVFKLECLKIKTKLNHFALHTKLLISANQSAFAQLKAISGA